MSGILLKFFLSFFRSEKPKTSDSKSSKVSQNSFDSDLISGSTSDLDTLVSRTFGGQLLNVYKCLKCKHESTRVESFNDLALAFVDAEKPKKSAKKLRKSPTRSSKNSKLSVAHMLDAYLQPETLTGDNKYKCNKCSSLQDAERSLRITAGPQCLILTLLRFAYDPKARKRTKIIQEVRYPRTLYVPVYSEAKTFSSDASMSSERDSSSSSDGGQVCDVYGLCAVIVHSGLSSDAGHYYCYARHSQAKPQNRAKSGQNSQNSPNGAASMEDVDYLEDKWFLFNDARVTFTDYSCFSEVSQKFARDTPYLLFYAKLAIGVRDVTDVGAFPAVTSEQVPESVLRRDMLEKIAKDNARFIQVCFKFLLIKEFLRTCTDCANNFYTRTCTRTLHVRIFASMYKYIC